ncbi:hypothetical protein [Desulfatibacillum aliphaticivorans]|uniref:hypothetical protein n=1 Tax=Desulfatibacillum aliphaticivorans TaxID=218208 RepID=UPI00048081D8|nr:hypothetical protein [Desulfatibacillum aliphaticivorans]
MANTFKRKRDVWIVVSVVIVVCMYALVAMHERLFLWSMVKFKYGRDKSSAYNAVLEDRGRIECTSHSPSEVEIAAPGFFFVSPHPVEKMSATEWVFSYSLESAAAVHVRKCPSDFQESEEYRDLKNMLYGDEPVSLYEFNRRQLQVTPDQISFFDSKEEIWRAFLLLMMKPLNADEHQYTASTENLNIIQLGFPTPNPPDIGAAFGPVRCWVFGKDDKSYEIDFIGLDQEAIDCILASFTITETPMMEKQ